MQQFELDVRHKPGKKNVIPDVLSRLASANEYTLPSDHAELDVLYAYTTTLVEMSKSFQTRIVKGYQSDPSWTKTLDVLYAEDSRAEDGAKLQFVLGEEISMSMEAPSDRSETYTHFTTAAAIPEEAFDRQRNRLVYHIDKATAVKRLCIPESVVKDILDIAHTAEGYLGFARCYERVATSWYIRGLTRYLRDYLKHCSECLVYQTRRHAPYGTM